MIASSVAVSSKLATKSDVPQPITCLGLSVFESPLSAIISKDQAPTIKTFLLELAGSPITVRTSLSSSSASTSLTSAVIVAPAILSSSTTSTVNKNNCVELTGT